MRYCPRAIAVPRVRYFAAVMALTLMPSLREAAHAQTIVFHNTDAGRPLRVEDALAVPRYALDLSLAPSWRGNAWSGATG